MAIEKMADVTMPKGDLGQYSLGTAFTQKKKTDKIYNIQSFVWAIDFFLLVSADLQV